MNDRDIERKELELRLVKEFGELLTSREIAKALRFPSQEALLKARQQGRLPIALIELPGRRGYFASAERVAAAIQQYKDLER